MIISAVGAGGKTTLLRKTAERLSLCGETVVLTTTTKIRKPELSDIREWEKNGGRIRVFGTPAEEGKLAAPSEQEFQMLFRHFRHVLIEADGAKRFPLKVPADREPVIRKETELVVCVAGMSALGRPLREACFRWELLPETLRDGGRLITVEDMVLILGSEWGGRKGTSGIPFRVFLNQCDTEKQRESAMQILELLRVRWGVDGDCGALQNGAAELLHWTNCPKSVLKDI